MTITRISPGVWELRTRHGTLIATGDLHTVVNVCARAVPRRLVRPTVRPPSRRSLADGRMHPQAQLPMPRLRRLRTGRRGLAARRNESEVSLRPGATPLACQLSARSRLA